MLVDTHCHLFMEPLADDPEGVVKRAREAGVGCIVVPAFDMESWSHVKALSGLAGVYPALGLHPWKASEDFDSGLLADALESSGAVAVGEIGLDSKIDDPGMDVQVRVFRAQLDLAVELDLPVSLHCRGAFGKMLAVLEEYAGRLRGVVHAFSRGPETAKRFVELGMHIAFGGAVTRPVAGRARASAASVPPEMLLLETDAPSIGMEGLAPGEVEPVHVTAVAVAVAELRKLSPGEVADITTANAERLFRFHGCR